MKDSNLTTIASYSFPHEAHIARANLEAEGIPAFVADEHTVGMQWLYSQAVGGVKLQVPAPFVEQAKSILAQDFSHLLDEEFGRDETFCPRCGSSEVEPYTKGKKPAFVVFLLLGFPLFFYRHGMRCRACGEFTPN